MARVATPKRDNVIRVPDNELNDYLAKGYILQEDWHRQEVEKAEAAWATSQEALEQKKAEKIAEIENVYQAALAASLTMPQDSPSPADVAVGAALFASEDAEGLEYVANTHAQRRAALLHQVEQAENLDRLDAVMVSFAV